MANLGSQREIFGTKKAQLKHFPLSDWLVGMFGGIFLIGQTPVGGTIPRRVGLSYTGKVAEHEEPRSKALLVTSPCSIRHFRFPGSRWSSTSFPSSWTIS